MQFSQLKSDLKDYVEDRTGQMNALAGRFINNALVDIQRRRFWKCMSKLSSFSTVAGTREYPLITHAPRYIASDVMKRRGATADADIVLVKESDWEEFQRRMLDNGETTGAPLSYIVHVGSNVDNGRQSIWFFPTPNAIYSMEFWHHRMLPELVQDADENWFTEFAHDLVLYRACMLAGVFLQQDITGWQALFEECHQAAVRLDRYESFHRGSIARNRAYDSGVS
jgi:hypothetical protein